MIYVLNPCYLSIGLGTLPYLESILVPWMMLLWKRLSFEDGDSKNIFCLKLIDVIPRSLPTVFYPRFSRLFFLKIKTNVDYSFLYYSWKSSLGIIGQAMYLYVISVAKWLDKWPPLSLTVSETDHRTSIPGVNRSPLSWYDDITMVMNRNGFSKICV